MITAAAIERLRTQRTDEPAVVSAYLCVPVDVADHRGLPARVRDLIRAAAAREPRAQGREVSAADVEAIVRAVDQRSQEWLGHGVGLFACSRIGLFEAVVDAALADRAGRAGELAVIADRPHVRPLLAALQRHRRLPRRSRRHPARLDPAHLRRRASRRSPSGPAPGCAARTSPAGTAWRPTGCSSGSWSCPSSTSGTRSDSWRTRNDGTGSPLVLGGHDDEITQFVGLLPRAVRQQVAGSFTVDLQTATPGRVRELAQPVIASWNERTEDSVVEGHARSAAQTSPSAPTWMAAWPRAGRAPSPS